MKWSELDRWEKVGVIMVSPAALIFVVFILLFKALEIVTDPLFKTFERGVEGWLKLARKEDSDE